VFTPRPFGPPGSASLKLTNLVAKLNVGLYRRTGGRLGGKVSGAPVLLLDHVGRKSGQPRTAPLIYTRDGDDLVIVASRAGSDFTPAWWLNLKAKPETTVQVGSERLRVAAREAVGEERDRLWPLLVDNYGDYDVYRERTDRVIPVVVLTQV
jgi:deazaflavin-dependent oxidoreductase (nitroreductase family)